MAQDQNVLLEIKVTPQSRKSELLYDKNGSLKCFVKSPARQGLANEEIIEIFAKRLKIPKNKISIKLGHTTRLKHILIISPYSKEIILEKLGLKSAEQQLKIFR